MCWRVFETLKKVIRGKTKRSKLKELLKEPVLSEKLLLVPRNY
jgi:hypothetical protein